MVDKAVAGASMEIPDRMVEGQIDNMLPGYSPPYAEPGPEHGSVHEDTGMTMDQMRDQMRPQALKSIQTRLVLEEVVKAENIEVSDERSG